MNIGVGDGYRGRHQALGARLVGPIRQTLVVLFGAVGFVLLIACVNVANLLIARGAARQRELAVRSALGGGRIRLATQLLVESTLVSAIGCALGVGFAASLLRLLIAFAPGGTPPATVKKISAEVAEILKSPAVVANVRTLTATVAYEDDETFAAFLQGESEKWKIVLKDLFK